MTAYVLGFCFTRNFEQVLLIRKARPAWQAGKWNGLGGKVELTDDSPASAMRREFREESGVDVRSWTHFARLRGRDFLVLCFWSVEIHSFLMAARGAPEEPVCLLESTPSDGIANLPWLLAMAKVHAITGTEPVLEIRYPSK